MGWRWFIQGCEVLIWWPGVSLWLAHSPGQPLHGFHPSEWCAFVQLRFLKNNNDEHPMKAVKAKFQGVWAFTSNYSESLGLGFIEVPKHLAAIGFLMSHVLLKTPFGPPFHISPSKYLWKSALLAKQISSWCTVTFICWKRKASLCGSSALSQ